jgi:hypothetical protein
MPSLIQNSFKGGEWGADYWARTDLALYQHALRFCRNMIAMPQGGVTRRPGTRAVALAQTSDPVTGKVRLKSFGPSSARQYTIEIGSGYFRFYRNRAQVQSPPGTPYQISNPYAVGDLPGLGFLKTAPPETATALWLFHGLWSPRQLVWQGADNSWALNTPNFLDGPYLDAIGAITTATPGAAAASATLTLNNTTEVNNGTGFRADDVGRCIRFLCPTWELTGLTTLGAPGATYHVGDTINPAGGTPLLTPIAGRTRQAVLTVTAVNAGGGITGGVISDGGQYLAAPSTAFTQGASSGLGTGLTGTVVYTQSGAPVWIWGTITAWHSTTSVDVAVQPLWIDAVGAEIRSQAGQFLSTAAITTWRLGAWCPFEGFPSRAGVFQGRLALGGQSARPKRLWLSESTLFLSMAPSLANRQVVASNAISIDLDDDQSDAIVWISAAGSAQIPQLAIGCGDAEFVVQPSSSGAALSPTNIQVFRETRYGSANIPPTRLGRVLLMFERGAKKLRQWMYQYLAGGFVGPEAAPYAPHLFLASVKESDLAQVPWPIHWQIDNAGQLAGLTFQFEEKEPANDIAAWHAHPLGGSYWGGPPLIESLAVQQSEDQSYDQLWLAVLRNDNGNTTRTIEVLDRLFRARPLSEAVFVDGSISTNLTMPPATCIPAPFTPVSDANGTRMLPARGEDLGFNFDALVANAADLIPGTVLRVNSGTFVVTVVGDAQNITARCVDPPSSLMPAPTGTWSYTKMATSFTGFGALANRTVQLIGDGQDLGTMLFKGDPVVTAQPVSLLTMGLPYPSEIDTLDLDLPARDGTSQMKTGRLDHLYLRLFETTGCEYGPSPDSDNLLPSIDRIEARSLLDDLTNWGPGLVSDDFRVAHPGGSAMHRRIRVRALGPWPLTVQAIVAKGGTNEIAPT